MDAVQETASAAINNGAKAAVSNPLPIGKGISLATDLGFGFTGLAVAATAATFSLNAFKNAWTTVRS